MDTSTSSRLILPRAEIGVSRANDLGKMPKAARHPPQLNPSGPLIDELVRTPDGWKISKRAERDYFHNMPPDFHFE
jgi:hypothetical protein